MGQAGVKDEAVTGGTAGDTQVWPDAPNHPDFPQAVLRPGEVYRQRTEFRFRCP